MFENFVNFFSRPKAGDIAKDRLQVLLKIDRQNTAAISEEMMENLKEDLMAVIQKYMDIELDDFNVKMERTRDESGRVTSALVANIPINKIK
ncbi:MAG: cell division topological specificity factor MinE [Clostridia bacterium]|nr:cell division topological specificity factor MinE [Clostridia bacterium]